MVNELSPAEVYDLACRNYVLRTVIQECLDLLERNKGDRSLLIRRIRAALDGKALPIPEDDTIR